MKKFRILFLLFVISLPNYSYCQIFKNGSNDINLSVGMGSTFLQSGNTIAFAPICLTFDHGIVDNIMEKGSIGIGGLFGYSSSNFNNQFSSYTATNWTISARGTFHYPLVDRLDTYGGILIGYNIVGIKITGFNAGIPVSGPMTGIFIGAKYYFTNDLAIFSELGYNISWLNFGISLKLN